MRFKSSQSFVTVSARRRIAAGGIKLAQAGTGGVTGQQQTMHHRRKTLQQRHTGTFLIAERHVFELLCHKQITGSQQRQKKNHADDQSLARKRQVAHHPHPGCP